MTRDGDVASKLPADEAPFDEASLDAFLRSMSNDMVWSEARRSHSGWPGTSCVPTQR